MPPTLPPSLHRSGATAAPAAASHRRRRPPSLPGDHSTSSISRSCTSRGARTRESGRCVDMRMHTHAYGPLLCAVRSLHCHAPNTVAPQVGRIHTPHGVIDTPGFVPVGTNAALKHVDQRAPAAAGVQLMFVNTYHMLVHPGSEVVAAAGGLHKVVSPNPNPNRVHAASAVP